MEVIEENVNIVGGICFEKGLLKFKNELIKSNCY